MTALAQVADRLASSDPEERRRATSELARLEADDCAELVLRALSDEDWRVRKEGVTVALAFAPNRKLLSALVSALSSAENIGLRNAAVEALAGFGEDAVEHVARAMHGLDADGRKLAVEALGKSAQPTALPVLSRLLDDDDANVRVTAVEAVAALGAVGVGEVTTILERCLLGSEPMLALAALDGLNALGTLLPWRTIEACLSDPMLRAPALLAAGRSADPRAVPVVLAALDHTRGRGLLDVTCALRELSRDSVARAALRASGKQVTRAVAEQLRELVLDEQQPEEARRAALVVLGAMALPGAAETALSALGDDRFLAEAHETLELLGVEAAPALIEAARSGDALARASCLSLLSRIVSAPDTGAALAAGRAALDDPSPDVQREALGLLATLGDAVCITDVATYLSAEVPLPTAYAAEAALRELAERHPAAARQLVDAADANASQAYAACVIIGALGARSVGVIERDIEFLSAALSNPSGAVRRASIEVLAVIGGARAVDVVAFALTDEERDVRRVAVAALGRMRGEDGSAAGVPHLVALVQHAPDPELLGAVVRALGETGDPHALSVLKPLSRSVHPYVAVSAVEALAQLGGSRRVDALIEALTHGDAEVVKATMLALSDVADARVTAHLGACLDHDAWDVRRLAADLLGRVSGDTALGLLRARLGHEDSPPVQEAIGRALERTAGVRRVSVPASIGSLRPR